MAGLAACVWRSVTTDVSPVGSLILPDGCMDLVWSPGREPFVAGPDRTAWAVADPVGTVHVGVRFRPGAGPAVIGVPAVELVNQQVPLADLWGSAQARAVTEQLEGAASAAEAIRALVGSVADRQREADGVVVHAVDIVSRRAAGHRAPLDGGLGERQIRRRFVAAVGYGPKTLERILRFQRFLRIARHDAPGQRPHAGPIGRRGRLRRPGPPDPRVAGSRWARPVRAPGVTVSYKTRPGGRQTMVQ